MSGLYYPQARATLQIVFDGFGNGDSEPTVVQVLPIRATATLNGYKEADTWELEFDAHLLPFSPELIRSCGVEIYMYETLGNTDNPHNYATDDNIVIAGLADNCTIQYSASGHTFHMDGRDYTALFLDKPWKPDNKIPVGFPLDETIKKLSLEAQTKRVVDPDTGTVRFYKPLRPLDVEFISEASAPVVGSKVAHDRRLTQKKVKGKPPVTGHGHSAASKHGIPFKSGQSYWDVMYKLCLRHGFICYVRGTTIIISDPKTLNDEALSKAVHMAYGRNLEELSIERHLGKETVPQIVVTSYDKTKRQTLEARWPKKYKGKQTGFGTFKEEERRYAVNGITDVGLLERQARTIYHSLARTEGKLKFTTRDLKDLPEDPTLGQGPNSLLALRAGDAVSVGFDPFDESELRRRSTFELRYSLMRELGYSNTVASLVARDFEKINQLKQPWYTRKATFEYDTESGIHISVEGVNFISAPRDDIG